MAILDIPQVRDFSYDSLQSDLHMGFGVDIKTRFENARWTDAGHTVKRFPNKVDAQIDPFIAAYNAEDDAYVIAQGSDLTKQRDRKDSERDSLYREVKKTIDTFAVLSIFPAKQQAALVVQPVMLKYKIDPDGGIEAQTVATDQWLQEHMSNANCMSAAEELGLTASIAQLKTLNDDVRRLTAARNDERSQQESAALRNARSMTEQTYKALILALNAAAIMDDDETAYDALIRSINETIKYYRQLSEQRRKKNASDRSKGGNGGSGGSGGTTPVTPDNGGTDDNNGGGDDNNNGGGDDDNNTDPVNPTPDPDNSGGTDNGGGSDNGGGGDNGGGDDNGGGGAVLSEG